MATPSTPASTSTKRKRNRIQPEPIYAALRMDHVPTTASILPPPTTCTKCNATKFAYECPTLCCYSGKVHLASNNPPAKLIDLFTRQDDLGTHFRKHARLYNNFFAFSSLGGNFHKRSDKGIYTLTLHGQLYHFIPDLLPQGQNPNYLQMYFYDGAAELDTRLGSFKNLSPEVISILMEIMDQNPYAYFFRSLREFNITEESRISISHNPVLDQRVFNAPTTDEVAAIFVEDTSSTPTNSPHIIVHGKSNQTHRVLHYFGCYDPLQYPLLFPRGESGWHQNLKASTNTHTQSGNDITFPISNCLGQDASDLLLREEIEAQKRPSNHDKNISCREYYAYKLQIRPDNYLLQSGRIFLQYIDDMYVKVENTRLDYLRQNQAKIRSELYQGIVDCVNDGNRSAASVGKRIVLPPSFIGGPRDLRCRYLNAMSLVQKYGKPDLFITVTCNPKWKEITDQLLLGQKPEDRPDLLARIFRAKLVHLKREIMEKHIFGQVAARVEVVEFQKRGLPHAHILLILIPEHKILRPEDFDKYVSAELPPTSNPYLRSRVVQHMIHGPCGTLNPNCACMKQVDYRKKCKSNYPKNYAPHSTCGDDSYPIYMRRQTDESIFVRGSKLDNRWVIPYNPYLLATFDCHINVEICSTVEAVKYLYKYIYKGHDRVCFGIAQNDVENVDEIISYQSARWISPPEAAWRIFGFPLYEMSPAVIPLQIHLPQLHPVTFREYDNLQNVVANTERQTTMLSGFFKFNADHPDMPRYLYSDFPYHYVWNKSARVWTKRGKAPCVGRLTYANPAEGERYYLRLLLANIKAPKSFEDLRTVDGHTCVTFQEAAEKHRLVEQDDYADACMEEAAKAQMPSTLRRLFATLLVHCEHINPQYLWERHYNSFSEDFSYLYKQEPAKVQHLTCVQLEKHLEPMGKSLKHYKLEKYHHLDTFKEKISRDISDALHAPTPASYLGSHKRLNEDQRAAYKCIMHHVKQKKAGAFFIDGPGGTGKTFLYCALYAKVRSLGKIVLPTATSGIAASNIPTGRTAHSRFKLPIDDNGSLTCNVSKQSSLAHLLQATSLLIWDEASMAKKQSIESLHFLLQDLCDSTELFGGKIIVFGGDFRQVLPVLPRKTQHEAVCASMVNSFLWPKLMKFKLTYNIRAQQDPEFADFLLQLGNGSLQKEEISNIQIPHHIADCITIDDNCFNHLVAHIFPEMNNHYFDNSIFCTRAILSPTNKDVDTINTALINKFPGNPVTYKSFDTAADEYSKIYPTEFLNTLCPSGMSPHELVLKQDAPVILLRNLDPPSGLCNGTRLTCKRFFRNTILCEISAGYYKGENVFLPRITLKAPSSSTYSFQFQRKQFPIKLCFAMTINKSQGQTLERVGMYLRQPCFSHGQLYVGCSRAKTSQDLKIFTSAVTTSPLTKQLVQNITSYDILYKAEII